MPRVSVVIPAYNAARTVGATIGSVLRQTFDDLEVVVVDDGSSDDTAALAEAAGGPVRVVRQPNAGVSAARNRGIESSAGELLAFLDADDTWEPRKLELQVAALDAEPTVGLTYASTLRVDEHDRVLDEIPATQYDDPCAALLLVGTIVSGSCSSAVVRRDVLGDSRFDSRFSQCADWDMWLRLSTRARFGAVSEPLVRYRTTAGNMSSDSKLLERDTFAVLDAFYARPESAPYRAIRRRAYSNHWMIVAGSHLAAGRRADAMRAAARGVALRPQNLVRPLGLPVRAVRRRLRT